MSDDILDKPDYRAEYDRLRLKIDSVQNRLKTLTVEYLNKMGQKPDDDVFDFRNALIYRLDCVLQHLNYLISRQLSSIDSISKLEDHDKIMAVIHLSYTLSQLFDSIIFHSVSAFDYFGNMIEYMCFSKTGKCDRKWNGIVQAASNPGIPFSKSPIAPTVTSLHNDFVNSLYRYRSQLIHYTTDLAGGTSSFDWETHDTSFTIFAPEQIDKDFHNVVGAQIDQRMTLAYISCWLVEKTCDSFASLFNKVSEHLVLNRKTSEGTHFITLRDGTLREI